VWKVEFYDAGYVMKEKCFTTKMSSEQGFGTKINNNTCGAMMIGYMQNWRGR